MAAFDNPIQLSTLAGLFAGNAAAVYPSVMLVATQTFPWAVWIPAIQFSTSLTIFPGTNNNLGGMLLTVGKQPLNLAIAPGLQSVIVHVTGPNSIPGATPIASPSSKVSNITFSGCGYYLPTETPIGLYAFADATAGNSLIGIASIQFRQAD